MVIGDPPLDYLDESRAFLGRVCAAASVGVWGPVDRRSRRRRVELRGLCPSSTGPPRGQVGPVGLPER